MRRTGTIHGTVTLSDGTSVENAQMTTAGKEAPTDALGNYEFLAIPSGDYVVRAEKLVLRADHTALCPSNGSEPCDRLTASAPVHVDPDTDVTVDLVLTLETVTVPSSIADKMVLLRSDIHMVDDEGIGDDDVVRDLTLIPHCVVNPDNPDVDVVLPPECVGNELALELSFHCHLADSGTVEVTAPRKHKPPSRARTRPRSFT